MLMLFRMFNNTCLRVTAPNATEAERQFYERSPVWFCTQHEDYGFSC